MGGGQHQKAILSWQRISNIAAAAGGGAIWQISGGRQADGDNIG